MSKLKHWTAFLIFWAVMGPIVLGVVAAVLYLIYRICNEYATACIVLASVGAFVCVVRWAGNYLDERGFLPWKPKGRD
jgi:integral membrane sensor domain MASE1